MRKILLLFVAIFFGGVALATDYDTLTSKKYVDDAVAEKQDALTINTPNTVMVYTNRPGTVGQKGIYDPTGAYETQTSSLVTAGTANTAIQNAIDSEFVCANSDCSLLRIGPAAYTGKNLFDKNNLTRIPGYFPDSNSQWTYAALGYSIRIPCQPNTTYTARYTGNSTQAVLSFASTWSDDVPTSGQGSVGVTSSTRQNSPTINTPITLTTGANDKWLIVAYNVAEPQNSDMAEHLQIEQGSTATAYEPYVGPYLPHN